MSEKIVRCNKARPECREKEHFCRHALSHYPYDICYDGWRECTGKQIRVRCCDNSRDLKCWRKK